MGNGSKQDSAVSNLYGPSLDDVLKEGERSGISAADREANRKMMEIEIAALDRFGPNATPIIQPPEGQFQEKDRGRFEWASGDGLLKNLGYSVADWVDVAGDAMPWLDRQLFGDYPGEAWNEQWEPGPLTVEGNARNQPGGRYSPEWAAAMAAIGHDRYAEAEEEARQAKIQAFIDGGGIPGEGSEEALPEEDIYGDLLALYEEMASGDRGYANQMYNTIVDYLDETHPERAAQIMADSGVINQQLDDMYAEQERRDFRHNIRFEEEFQDAIQGMEATGEASDARLNEWGVDPNRWTAGAKSETATLLNAQARSGARFANEMGAIATEAHRLATARVNQGMHSELRNLANSISQMGLQANLQLQQNLQSIDRQLMMNKIGVETAAVALAQMNAQSESSLMQQMAAYMQLQNMTGTPAQSWMAADTLGLTGDLFARTPMLAGHSDTMRPIGIQQASLDGNLWDIPFNDIGELSQILEAMRQYEG